MLAARRLALAAPRVARTTQPLMARRRPVAPSSLSSRWLSTAGTSDAEAGQKAEEAKAAAAEGAAAEEGAAAAAEGDAAEGAAASEDGGASAAPAEEADPVAELEAKVTDLEEQVKTKHDQVLRALAEAENARRRAKLDVEEAHKFAVGKFAKSLLDVADVLKLAANSVPEEQRTSDEQPVLKALYEGVVMTDSVLHKAFEGGGLKKVWPIDEKFDPNFHNALFEMPDPTKEPGTVGHVETAGYVLNDRCIRAAGVGIVKKPDEAAA